MNIIAADVGGTKAWLVLADTDRPDDVLYEARYASGDFDGFEPLLETFIKDSGLGDSAQPLLSLALPGVIDGGEARLTNLPWTIRKADLRDEFGVGQIHFMNDFQASALGTLHLQAHDLVTLNPGVHKDGATRVAVGAGTGLGVSWITGGGNGASAWSTEGGHVDFAPVDEEQVELLRFLIRRHGHVSYERLLSGAGLSTLYAFCSGEAAADVEPAWVHAQAEQENATAVRAMTLFIRIYGAFVGNLALLFKPEGGIYITGGIAAKIINWMKSEEFISAYSDKGRMRSLAEQTSVHLVTNERVGVIGAVAEAVKQAGNRQ